MKNIFGKGPMGYETHEWDSFRAFRTPHSESQAVRDFVAWVPLIGLKVDALKKILSSWHLGHHFKEIPQISITLLLE